MSQLFDVKRVNVDAYLGYTCANKSRTNSPGQNSPGILCQMKPGIGGLCSYDSARADFFFSRVPFVRSPLEQVQSNVVKQCVECLSNENTIIFVRVTIFTSIGAIHYLILFVYHLCRNLFQGHFQRFAITNKLVCLLA